MWREIKSLLLFICYLPFTEKAAVFTAVFSFIRDLFYRLTKIEHSYPVYYSASPVLPKPVQYLLRVEKYYYFALSFIIGSFTLLLSGNAKSDVF